MSTFQLIWDLCKLKPETRWNWPSFSNKLIFWPGLWEDSQRFRAALVSDITTYRFIWSPELVCAWDSVQSCCKASLDMAKGKPVNRPFCNKNPCLLLFNLPLSLAFWLHWLSQAHVSNREYIWKGPGGANALVFATDLKSPLKRKLKYFLKWKCYLREDLLFCLYLFSPSETVAKYCRKWQVYKMNGSLPTNTCRRGN